MNHRKRPVLFYLGYVLGWTVLISAAGALLGAIAYPIGAKLFGFEGTVGKLALTGARDLGFVTFIWAPGAAIVLAVRRAYLQQQQQRREKHQN